MIKYLLFLIYPLILFLCFLQIFHKYTDTIKSNIKPLIINTAIVSLTLCVGLFIFLSYEDTIYTYDYAGHWIRSLEIKNLFINNPRKILPLIYESMNNMDYSYLPALFIFPFLLIKEGYRWFSITNYFLFLLPTVILLQIIYFDKTKLNKYLPSILLICIYPIYLTLFYGKVDVCGLFFITMCYALVIFKEKSTLQDNISINLFAFLAIFLRRWYLYSVVCFYIIYLIQSVYIKERQQLIYYLVSFIPLFTVVCLFFWGFVSMSLNNNFTEAYQFYNQNNKIFAFINYFSPLMLLVVALGAYQEFKDNKLLLLFNIISISIPCIMIWKIQSFEYHHYYIFLLNILILFISGLKFASGIKTYIIIFITLLMTTQAILIFTPTYNIPLFTKIKKQPEILNNKEQLIDISNYIKSIETDDDTSVFIAGGAYGIINDDLLRNAFLPNLDYPNIDSSVFDIRDGFPRDMQYIRYIMIVNPMLYMDQNYQHIYDVISEAILNVPEISSLYTRIKIMPVNDQYSIDIYEKSGVYTTETKEYFYKKMIEFYPDKTEFFKYILD